VKKKGLIIIHTGDGKGKTTAALGLAMRAWGNGLRILVLQFIKGGWKYGELKTMEQLAPRLKVKQCGEGFTQRNEEDKEKHKAAAQQALKEAEAEICSERWEMIILDEINYAVKFNLIEESAVLHLLEIKPKNLHLVLTGRDVSPSIIQKADLVTEMKEVKHPYKKGIKAQKGIEF
jgi:cob(I)alamin adenosyltransferase